MKFSEPIHNRISTISQMAIFDLGLKKIGGQILKFNVKSIPKISFLMRLILRISAILFIFGGIAFVCMPKYGHMFWAHNSAIFCPIWIKFHMRVPNTTSTHYFGLGYVKVIWNNWAKH